MTGVFLQKLSTKISYSIFALIASFFILCSISPFAVATEVEESSAKLYIRELNLTSLATAMPQLRTRNEYTLVDDPYSYDETMSFSSYGYVGAAFFTSIQSSQGLQIPIKEGYTYDLTLTFNNANVSSWNFVTNGDGEPYYLVALRSDLGVLDRFEDGVFITDYITDSQMSVSVQNSLGTATTTVRIIFNTSNWLAPDGAEYQFIAPWLYCRAESRASLKFLSCSGTVDYDQTYFDQLIYGALTDFANQNHKDLQDIKDELHEAYWYEEYLEKTLDDTEVKDFQADISDIYSSMDSFTADFDGESIAIDSNTFNKLTAYLESSAHGYNILVGQPFNRVFTLFANYLAVPMTLSLMLGLIVWFLGRRVDV